MELRQLRYFVAVAEELHFGRAAQRVHVAQPALSEQVRKLEAELGVRLLERSRRAVALTPAGAALLDDGRRVLRQAEAAERAAREADIRARARLRVGYVPDGLPPALPRALQRFRSAAPQIEVVLDGGATLPLIDHVREDRLDAAIVWLPAPVAGLRTTALAEETAVAAVPAGHGPGPVRLDNLGHTTLVLVARDRNAAFHDAVLAAAGRMGLAPARVATIPDGVEAALLAVAAGRGVAILPTSVAAREPLPGVRFAPLATPLAPCRIVVVTRRDDASTTTAAFLRVVRANAPTGSAVASSSARAASS